MRRPLVLVVDDDKSIRTYLSDFLSSRGYRPLCVESGELALDRVATGTTPDVAILDVGMSGLSGMEVLERLRQANASIPVIMLTVLGETSNVVAAMRLGADDYLTKPFEEEELELALEKALERSPHRANSGSRRSALRTLTEPGDDFLSSDKEMSRLRDIARRVADTDVPVLITGESGVGKEVVARFIHARSSRRDKPLVKVNCAALPRDLLEAELFGHERGAFTGAVQERPGKFEIADGSTLLLDEIGELSRGLQAKLLHVLQDGEYSRLGASRPMRADVRILAATNRSLASAIHSGSFREDLYFRLNVIQLEIPPLRDRKGDVPLLCDYFLQKYREKYRSSIERLPEELASAFERYDWPGNVRQLENAVKRYVVLPELQMSLRELEDEPERSEDGDAGEPEPAPATSDVSLKHVSARAAESAEKALVRRVLEESDWNRKAAARRLKISYKALLNKLKKWELDNRTDPSRMGLDG